MEDLEAVISSHRKALNLFPLDHPNCSYALSNLGIVLFVHFNQSGRIEDLEEATTYHHEALTLRPLGHPDHSSALTNLGVA